MTNLDLIVLADECVSAEDVERMVAWVERQNRPHLAEAKWGR